MMEKKATASWHLTLKMLKEKIYEHMDLKTSQHTRTGEILPHAPNLFSRFIMAAEPSVAPKYSMIQGILYLDSNFRQMSVRKPLPTARRILCTLSRGLWKIEFIIKQFPSV